MEHEEVLTRGKTLYDWSKIKPNLEWKTQEATLFHFLLQREHSKNTYTQPCTNNPWLDQPRIHNKPQFWNQRRREEEGRVVPDSPGDMADTWGVFHWTPVTQEGTSHKNKGDERDEQMYYNQLQTNHEL